MARPREAPVRDNALLTPRHLAHQSRARAATLSRHVRPRATTRDLRQRATMSGGHLSTQLHRPRVSARPILATTLSLTLGPEPLLVIQGALCAKSPTTPGARSESRKVLVTKPTARCAAAALPPIPTEAQAVLARPSAARHQLHASTAPAPQRPAARQGRAPTAPLEAAASGLPMGGRVGPPRATETVRARCP